MSATLNRGDPRNPPRLEVNAPKLDIKSEAITREEIRKSIRQLKNGKAPRYDETPAELLKADIETTSEVLFVLFYWHGGLIVKIPKKGDTTESVYQLDGIILLSVVSKVFTRIILIRIQRAVDN